MRPSLLTIAPFTIEPMRPPRRRRRALRAGVIIAASAIVFTGGMGAGVGLDRGGALDHGGSVETGGAEFDLIRQAWDLLESEYVGARDLDERDLAYGAIEGMTEAVGDTGHTDFMDPEERRSRGDALSGRYVGIGISVQEVPGQILVDEIFAGGPAAAAGLRGGDRIVTIDGRPVDAADIDGVFEAIRGEAGTTVVLGLSGADGELFEATITRAVIDVPAVAWSLVPGTTIADIALGRFQTGAADELEAAISAAKAKGATGFVLDLRGNGGGYTIEAIGVASQFLRAGVVYETEDARGTRTPFTTDPERVAIDLPLVVLVDESTASSAEIVAGALKDHGRATIVGQTTFGTGTVLGEYGLTDGSALRIGTVNWLTPKGTLIWHEGIAPDEVIARPDGSLAVRPDRLTTLSSDGQAASGDSQLLRAIEILAES
ncbi:MAG TPA: S41 family peptidase [Candidatus Limnocylindrales bacterium]|nr:S41 family peptidase [Candidatus Limnocylindrales bacterium]